jgi:hypothetical protein
MFLPEWVTFDLSEDGKTFTTVATVRNDVSPRAQQALTKDFVASFKPRKARFVKMTAQSLKVCPAWQKQAGEPIWMLFDELFAQ